MKRSTACFVTFVLCTLVLALVAQAHSISMVEGEALVHHDKIELTVKVKPEDILLSAGMTLIVADRIEKAVILKGAEAHKKYLLDGLVIQDAEGHKLTGKVTKVDLPTVPDDGIPMDELMAKTTVYHLEYPLTKPPLSLSFLQHFNTGVVAMPVVMELTVIREGLSTGTTIPVPDSDEGERVSFDWNPAPGPAAAVTAAKPAPQPAVVEPIEAFMYIENDEVRVEILMPLATLEAWVQIARTNKDFLEVAEQTAARPALEKLFTEHNELAIDNLTVKPTLDRLDFYGGDFKDFATRPEPRRLPVAGSRVGAILKYATKGAPRHVQLKWTLFNEKQPPVRAVVFAGDKGSRISFAPDKPTFAWDSPGVTPLPKIDAVPTKQTAADDAARAALAETLLRNIYRGFDYRSESDIYDALAQSVHGDLLTDLYLKIKQGLIVQEQGGAVAHVKQVKVTKSEPAAGKVEGAEGGFVERVTWQVEGTIEHWGHIHTRVNEYTADLGIAPSNGAWKIISMDVAKQTQVQNAVSLRKL
jgi:hypothetical protein